MGSMAEPTQVTNTVSGSVEGVSIQLGSVSGEPGHLLDALEAPAEPG